MPWKLIGSLVLLGVVLLFVGFNLENTTDISFGFAVLSDVPVFLSLFSAFFAGVLVTLPFAIRSSSRRERLNLERKERRRAKREERAMRKKQGSDASRDAAPLAPADAAPAPPVTHTPKATTRSSDVGGPQE